MVQLLERIEKNTSHALLTVRVGDLEVSGPDVDSVKAMLAAVTSEPKSKALEPGPGAGELDLAGFLGVDAVVETPAVSEDGDASTLASALFGEG
jgi:hypothetical protein